MIREIVASADPALNAVVAQLMSDQGLTPETAYRTALAQHQHATHDVVLAAVWIERSVAEGRPVY